MHTIELTLADLCGRDVKEQSFQNLGMDQEVDFRLSLPSDSQNDTTESGLPGSGSWWIRPCPFPHWLLRASHFSSALVLPPSLHHSAPSKGLHEPFYLAELNHTTASQQHRSQEMRVLLFYFFHSMMKRQELFGKTLIKCGKYGTKIWAYTDVNCQQEGTYFFKGRSIRWYLSLFRLL